MKKIVFTLMVLSLWLIGCGGSQEPATIAEPAPASQATPEPVQEETQVAPTQEVVVKQPKVEVKEDEPASTAVSAPATPKKAEPTPEPAKAESTLSPKLANLLSLADKKVKSVRYSYNEPPFNTGDNVWYVKGNKVKIELFESDKTYIEKKYNVVYLNMDTKKSGRILYG